MPLTPPISVSRLSGPRAAPTWWMLALVAFLAFAVYANSLKNSFAFDDLAIVRNNPHVVDLEWTTIWTDSYWPKVEGVQPDSLYRPLTLWSYLANQAIAPGVAWPFHLVNVLLHALVSLLIVLLAWRILGDRISAFIAGALFAVHPLHTEVVSNVVGRAELLAAVWSILMLLVYLPLRPVAEAPGPTLRAKTPLLQLAIVTLATALGIFLRSKRTFDPIVGAIEGAAIGLALGLFVALLLGFITRRSSPSQGIRPWWHGGLVALCFAIALLSKETPATLTFAIVFIDAWRFARWNKSDRPSLWAWFSSQAVRYYAPLALVVACYCRARINTGGLMSRADMVHRVVNPLVDATPVERLITPFMLLAKYILLTLWPVHLSADYSAPSLLPTANPFTGTSFQPPAIFGILICVLLITLALHFWKKRPQLLLLVGLTFFSYMLVANFVRIGTIFGERLFYWPSVFVLIIISWALVAFHALLKRSFTQVQTSLGLSQNTPTESAASDILHERPTPAAFILSPAQWKRLSTGLVASLALAAALMAVRTWLRNPDWADNTALAISTARDNPNSGKACSWAGSTLLTAQIPEYREFGKSLVERAIELSPDFVSARWEIAKYYGVRGEMGPSAVCVAQAARFDAGTHMTRTAIPALIQDLRSTDPGKYMPYIEDFQKNHPEDPAAYLALAFAYHAQADWTHAEQMAYKALSTALPTREDKPDIFHEAGAELASIRFDRGDVPQAVITMRKYTANIRNSVDARCTFVEMLLALDPKANPDAVKEAEYNLNVADFITPNNPRVREVRGRLLRYKLAVAKGQPIPSDIPAPRVTIAAEPKSEALP